LATLQLILPVLHSYLFIALSTLCSAPPKYAAASTLK